MKTNFKILWSIVLFVAVLSNSCKKDLPKPVADFTFENKEYYAPVEVQFTNTSNDATSYEWDFGDESEKSTEASPKHAYVIPGTYTVQLKATGEGGTNTSSKEITIDHKPIPIASFSYSGGFVVPVDISFTNLSQNTDTYLWDFGDGHTSTEANPTHNYTTPGNYKVRLLGTGEYGGSAMEQTITLFYVGTPTASFSFTGDGGNVPCTVSFTNTSTGFINSYLWDFGDGTTSTQENPQHTYNTDGTFAVTLIATGNYDSSYSVQYVSVSSPTPPTANFTASDSGIMAPATIAFTNTSTHATAYTWDFGDGSGTYTDVNPTHTFTHAGNFNVKLTATGDGGTDTFEQTIIVYEEATSIAITFVRLTKFPNLDGSGNLWDISDDSCDGGSDPDVYPYVRSNSVETWDTYSCTDIHFCNVSPVNPDEIWPFANLQFVLDEYVFITFMDFDWFDDDDFHACGEEMSIHYNFMPSSFIGEYPETLHFLDNDFEFYVTIQWLNGKGKNITTRGLTKEIRIDN